MAKQVTLAEIERWKKQIKPARVVPISELATEFTEVVRRPDSERYGLKTDAWPVFDSTFGGCRPGELISITGETGKGKTTFAIAWLMQLVLKKIPVLIFSLEMTLEDIVMSLAQVILEKNDFKIGENDIGTFVDLTRDMPVYIVEHDERMMQDEMIAKTIGYAQEKFGVRVVLIDHLDYIEKTNVGAWKTQDIIIGDTMRLLCRAAISSKVTVMLIVHPRKLGVKGVESREIGMDELKGSSSIKQESSAVFSIFRFDDDQTLMRVRYQKIRARGFSANVGGCIHFRYLFERSRFIEQSPSLERPKE